MVRIAARSSDYDRTASILRSLASGLRAFGNPNGNELIPLRNDDYPYEAHVADVVRRQSRRAGMILSAEELLGFVHLPSSAVRSPKFRRMLRKTKAAPVVATGKEGVLLGTNEHGGETREVRLTAEQRRKHMHIVGASGTGKTTLLYNLIRQDIEAGQGLAVLDPHGDLIDRILGCIPSSRIGDVVLLDPGDEEFSIGFNILSAHSDLEKNLLASDLVSVFQRLSTSWGDQMGIVLSNAIRAFLESERGGTLADLRRFLLEPGFREQFLSTVKDPDVVYYWKKGFTQLSGNKSIGPVMTRLETFLSPKPIRYMVSQPANRLDFGEIMDSGKIFLAKLSQGAIGKENSYLLGSLLMTKFHQMAMGRQRMQETARRDFWMYVDEFQNFVTDSMAGILTEARKYRLGLTLAHQELRQLQRDPEVAGAVLSNPYTRVCFRVGDADARTIEHGLSGFEARDLQNLGTGEAVCRVERSDYDFNLDVPPPDFPAEEEAAARRELVIELSRRTYATPRAEVEAALHRPEEAEEKPGAKPARVGAPPPPAVNQSEPATPPVSQPVPRPVPMGNTTVAGAAQPSGMTMAAGRGGMQHTTVQRRLKEAAEVLDFRAVIEQSILNNSGSVDLALSRAGVSIACEISITTTIDHEVGNVAKCLEAGYPLVAAVGVDRERLARLENAVRQSLGEAAAAKVNYFLPDELIGYLRELPPPVPPEPTAKQIRGYKVKRIYPQLTPEEKKRREDAAIQAIADLMKRKL
ncbi:type IV secretion system DNA-binding domain-containing protein [Opitutus sp. GAS368]|uniref:type IV secretory system conjugative DNA transfer family protein n=1 Tax=Opitutus sp. GAS368 TaxID=1882749 RepID=UPI00087C2CD8|nr:type IV secretion system DNA-binding domain-containing protein [Opitutus sp. GAS368]SDS02388.1 Type IV secretion-system coupling protein DNA-binding domain-containing protein [Opitutus sp. GAS368]